MVEPQPPSRTPGLVRLLGVFVLLASIVAMHAGVFAVAPAEDHHAMATMALPVDHDTAAGPDCTDDGCGHPHGGLHACVFILTAVAVALMLVLLYWITLDRPGGGMSKPHQWRPMRERAPPWTVLSLAELSILRI
ncbi:DUF6153 family protein [Nocardia sp. NPDC052112]|uniref:DUF6153 family protein n=1 Tax=Nocardia sp. NPDC052112 TaxID=3155646 RepID=UPI00344A2EBB